MKLRLHNGSLRLRLSQSEVSRLRETGKVEDLIVFHPGNELLYALKTGVVREPEATYDHSKISVTLPERLATEWIESDQTGLEASTGTLRLLIEKDFQCLHRSTEQEEDSFPNPLA
jgi:hypothetical protein